MTDFFTPQQITTMVVSLCGLIGLRVIAPLFGLVNASRGETKAQYLAQIEANKSLIADLQRDNRDLHERFGAQVADQRAMGDNLAALKVEVQYVKAANAKLLTDNAKLEAANVSLQLSLVKSESNCQAQTSILTHRIELLEDEVDEQLIFQDKPTKYEKLRKNLGQKPTSIESPEPQRFTAVTTVTSTPSEE